MKYKVSHCGFCYAEADSPENAEEKAMYKDNAVCSEQQVDRIEEADEFSISLEG